MPKETIKVFLRIRPDGRGASSKNIIPYEVDHDFDKSKVSFHIDRTNQKATDIVNHSIEDYSFKYNRVFEPNATQDQVFDTVGKECCQNVLDGYNSTVFAYGQTGSGKTFSITGGTESRAQRGLIPRAISMIYDEIAKRKEYQFAVGISYLQIYNDRGSDLLNRGEDAKSMEDLPPVSVNETDDDVILRGLECHPSASVEEALNLLFLGDTNRLYCETPMNKYSSRSHCIFTITLEARQHGSSTVRRSKLNLVDLAGSERIGRTGVSGTLQTEAKYINVSLLYLEQVIVALGEQARGRRDHIPYRNSMMTMVLRDSLGGNCKTVMLATAHPGLDQVWETMSTCRFATRVASIKTEAFVNEEQDPVMLIRNLKREVAQLKEQVSFLSDGKDSDPNRELSSDEMQRCQELVQKFLDDGGEDANLVGAGSDLARIHACFRILKKMLLKKGNNHSNNNNNNTPPPKQPITPPIVPPQMSSEQEKLLKEEVRRLRTSLQMKENELTLLFDLVNRNNTNTNNSSSSSSKDEIMKQLQLQQQNTSSSSSNANSTATTVVAQQQQQQTTPPPSLAQQQQSSNNNNNNNNSNYNLSALSDPELLKDRTVAFEAFRRSYRKHEQMSNCQNELQERIGVAKSLAMEINQLIDRMKASKTRVQQLRAERALKEDPEQVDPQETALLQELHETLRPQWTSKTDALKGEKEKIQHLQLLIKKNQEQLLKDFDSWYTTRQQQVSTALNTSNNNDDNNNTNVSSVSGRTVAAATGSTSNDNNNSYNNNTSSTSSSRSTTQPTKTGNPKVDAELQRMFDAREALKQRLSSNLP